MQPPRHSDQRQCSRRNDRLFRKINKGRRYCRPQSDCPAFSVWRRKSLSGGGDSQRPTEVIEIPKTSVLELFRKNEQFLENYMNLSANYARTLSDKLFSCLSRLSGRRLLLIYFAYISSNNSYISPSTDRNRN